MNRSLARNPTYTLIATLEPERAVALLRHVDPHEIAPRGSELQLHAEDRPH